jgi:hypothetical protein
LREAARVLAQLLWASGLNVCSLASGQSSSRNGLLIILLAAKNAKITLITLET